MLNLDLPQDLTVDSRRKTLGLIKRSEPGSTCTPDDTEFAARLNAYDLAFKMQTEAPAIFDLSSEPQETLDMYGIGKQPTDDYGRRCLLARRLIEKGVRFVVRRLGRRPRQYAVGRARRHRREPSAHGRRRPTSRWPRC